MGTLIWAFATCEGRRPICLPLDLPRRDALVIELHAGDLLDEPPDPIPVGIFFVLTTHLAGAWTPPERHRIHIESTFAAEPDRLHFPVVNLLPFFEFFL